MTRCRRSDLGTAVARLVGEQSSGNWGLRVWWGGGQAWGDECWGSGWPWRPPGCKHLPWDQLQSCGPGYRTCLQGCKDSPSAPPLVSLTCACATVQQSTMLSARLAPRAPRTLLPPEEGLQGQPVAHQCKTAGLSAALLHRRACILLHECHCMVLENDPQHWSWQLCIHPVVCLDARDGVLYHGCLQHPVAKRPLPSPDGPRSAGSGGALGGCGNCGNRGCDDMVPVVIVRLY